MEGNKSVQLTSVAKSSHCVTQENVAETAGSINRAVCQDLRQTLKQSHKMSLNHTVKCKRIKLGGFPLSGTNS